jgi:putative ABC transport system permease protein
MGALAEAIVHVARDFRRHKMRAALTVLGIVWGTVAVTLLLAFADGLEKQIAKRYAGLGDRIAIAWPGRTTVVHEGLPKGRRVRLAEDDMEAAAAQVPHLRLIAGEYVGKLSLHSGTRSLVADVSGVSPAFGEMRNLVPARGGRFLHPEDMAERKRVAVVGGQLARDLFGAGPAVGETVYLQGAPFLVVGVLQEKVQGLAYSGQDKDKVFIPAPSFRTLTGKRHLDFFVFQADTLARTPAVAADVRELLGRRRRFDPGDKGALSVWDMTREVFVLLADFFVAFDLFLAIVGALTLVVGGIGVSNIMSVVVEERSREIGIKMALGARRRWILRGFLLETLALTFVGGLLGLGVSLLVCAGFPRLHLGDYVGTPRVSAVVAALTTAILGTVGAVAGYFPARQAARLDPVTAMKA